MPESDLPILGPAIVDDEGVDDEPLTVLITGASGNIGRKLRSAWDGIYELILIDAKSDPADPDLIVADVAEPSDDWMDAFLGVDVVVHLAANPDPSSDWPSLVGPNLDGTANVLNAAALAGVERVIFASSNHAMSGYKVMGDGPITVDMPPCPGENYGVTKLVGERLGRSLAGAFSITYVALRIGRVDPGENRPDAGWDDWSRSIWLSDGDLIRLFTAAVEADLEPGSFVIVNGMSKNRGTRWDVESGRDTIGFEPVDDAYEGKESTADDPDEHT